MKNVMGLVFDTIKLEYRGTDFYDGPMFVGHGGFAPALMKLPLRVIAYGFVYPPGVQPELLFSFSLRREKEDRFVVKCKQATRTMSPENVLEYLCGLARERGKRVKC